MAYDSELAGRIRALVADEDGITERHMFGGLAFLMHGNMAVAASGQGGLLVRVDPDESNTLLDAQGVTPMVMRGREMLGWLRVETDAESADVAAWVERGLSFARSLPPKGD